MENKARKKQDKERVTLIEKERLTEHWDTMEVYG